LCEQSSGVGHCVIDLTCYKREANCDAIPPQYGGSVWFPFTLDVSGIIYLASVYAYTEGSPPNHMRHMGVTYTCNQTHTDWVPTAVTWPELFALVGVDIDEATDESAPIVDIINHGLDKAADVINEGKGIIAGEGTLEKDIEDKVNQGIPADEAGKLEDKLNDPDAVDEAIDKDIADTDNQKSITEAITDGLKSFFGDNNNVVVPVDPTITAPTKKNLTAILTSFYNSIQNLPIMSTLNGIAVTASGTSQLCVNLPANYGGTKCWDAAGNQADFNMIGSSILAVISILSVMHIFRG